MSVNSSSIVASLGAGSGIDIKTLAQSLVEAERKPFKDKIDTRIAKSEAKISGYGAILTYLRPLKESFEKLRNGNNLGTLTVSNSQPAAVTATAGPNAAPGSHTVSVLSLASSQRSRSVNFQSETESLNGGQAITLQLGMGSQALRPIAVSAPTPQAIVDAINADASANDTGINAQLVRVNSGGISQYTIEVQGQMGIDRAFTLAIDPGDYPQGQTPPVLQKDFLSEASDARVMVDGTRLVTGSTNSVVDANTKLTLNLSAVTATPALIGKNRDVQAGVDNIKSLVATYNDFQEALKVLSDRSSEVETLGGSLVGDALLQRVRTQMRAALQLADRDNSTVQALSGLGISVGLDGRMAIKSEKVLQEKLSSGYDDVVKLFTSSQTGSSKEGLVGDALQVINNFMPTYGKGLLAHQIDSNTKEVRRYKDQLTQLEARMAKSLERYLSQFSVMESIVGNSNSVRAGLKNTFNRNSD